MTWRKLPTKNNFPVKPVSFWIYKTKTWGKQESAELLLQKQSSWSRRGVCQSKITSRSALSARQTTHLLVVSPQHLQLSGAHQDVRPDAFQLLAGFLRSPAV